MCRQVIPFRDRDKEGHFVPPLLTTVLEKLSRRFVFSTETAVRLERHGWVYTPCSVWHPPNVSDFFFVTCRAHSTVQEDKTLLSNDSAGSCLVLSSHVFEGIKVRNFH